MTESKRIFWLVAGLVFLAFVLRVGLAVSRGLGDAPEAGTDQYEYDTYAWNLSQGRGYRGMSPDVADPDHLTAYRPPGPVVVWAGLYKVFGHRYEPVRVTNCLLSALTVGVVFAIGSRAYGPGVGVLAAAGYAVWPTAVLNSTELLSEPLGTFMFLSGIALALRFADERRWWLAGLAGFCLGYAALTRPNFVFLIPLTGVWILWTFWPSWRLMAKAALVPVTAGMVFVPWTVRNYVTFGRVIPLSSAGGSGLLQGNNRIVATPGNPRHGYSAWDTSIPEYAEALKTAGDEFERDRRAKAFAIQWIKDNKEKMPGLLWAKFKRAWTPFLQPHTPRLYRWGMLASWGPVVVLFPVAFAVTLLRAVWRREGSLLMHLAIVNSLIITFIFWGETRYRHGFEPLCLIWAAVTVVYLAKLAGWDWTGRLSGDGGDGGAKFTAAEGRPVSAA